LATLALVVAVFLTYQELSDARSPFLTNYRMTLIAKQSAIIGIGAVGMTVIIIGGGIDLSAGAMLALCSVGMAIALREGLPAPLALAATLGLGVAAGAANGLLVTGLNLTPFIVTLGTMVIYRGAAEWIARQQKIQAPAPEWVASLLDRPAEDSWQLLPAGVWIVLVAAAITIVLLRFTVWGRYVVAVGANEAAARLCGIRVSWIKLSMYAFGGLCMAIAGSFDFANLNRQGSPTSGLNAELEMIAAVVIGGGSLRGGRGSVLGSLVGTVAMTTLRNGCYYAEVSDPAQKVIIGGIIIAAVAIDQALRRARGEG
jgi:ribose transport system permease protein